MNVERLLELRNEMKAKKPDFVRQDAHKKKKLEEKWRRPRGIHSKLRRKFRGKGKHPSIGYSSPKKVRGLTREGLKPVLVHNLNELKTLRDGEGAVIARIGLKKKIEIVKKAIEMKIKLLNVKNPEKFLEDAKAKLEERKKKAEEREKKKKEKKKLEKKVEEEKKEKEEKKEEKTEETKKGEKSEKIKVLEKRR